MEKKLSLSELVKRYLAQPFTNFNYPDTSSDTPEEKKEEEETKKPIVYIPPSGGDGGGGIGSLGGGDGTFIGGGATLEDAGGVPELGGVYATDYQGEGFNFDNGEITADGPGYGTMRSGQDLGGGEITADGPGYGTMGTGIGGMGLGEFTADGPGFGTMGTGIGGGQGLGADANDGFADGQDFGADANDGFGNQDTGVSVGQDNTPNLGDRDTFNPETGSENSSGRKIVCTMMNQSYGFGSFRNKIWLKHSKGLAPEYQKGYHKIFLPLIKIAETNKIVRKILEHIAVHRTIDIRQESRGKVHLLGRAYRKILEPICYFVGKHG